MYKNIYFFIFFKKKATTTRQKAKQTKEEKRISGENLTGYDDIVSEFPLFTFNLLDRVVNFPWSLCEFNVVYVQREKYSICYTRTTNEVHTLKKKN